MLYGRLIVTFIIACLAILPARSGASSWDPENDIRFENPFSTGLHTQSMAQDRDGFLWFGTAGGLFRYDGHKLKKFVAGTNGLSTNYAPCVFVDSDGLIWVGTVGGGLNLYDKATNNFTVYRNEPGNTESISSNSFNRKSGLITEDKDGFLWLGTQYGLNRFDKSRQTFTSFLHDPNNPGSISDNSIWAVYADRDDLIWVGTNNNGLDCYDKKTGQFKHYRFNPEVQNSLSNNEVLCITEDSDGYLWIGTKEGGLNRYDKQHNRFDNYWHDPANPFSLSHDEVSHIEEDAQGNLWLSRTYSTAVGVERLNKKTGEFTRYKNDPKNPDSISGNVIIQSFEDNAGILWFVNNNGKIDKYDKNTKRFGVFQHNPDNPFSLGSNTVTTIFQDSHENIWLGTFLGGLNRYDKAKNIFRTYKNNPSDINTLLHNYAFSVFEDSTGLLWAGTDDGILNIIEKQTGRVKKRFQNPFSNQVARSILEDRQANHFLWFGTESDGLFRFNKETGFFKQYKNDPANPDTISFNGMNLLFFSDNGTLWIATFGGGLNKYLRDTDTFISFRHNPDIDGSISSNVVNDCQLNSHGNFWVATDDGGLNEFDPATGFFKNYGYENGFPTESIKSIVEDDNGMLWLGSDAGILKFNPVSKRVEKNYTKSDGLPSNKMSMYATGSYKSKDGRLWFATVTDGLISFFPEQIKDNTFIPPVVLTSFRQGHNEIDLFSSATQSKGIELSWLYNFFEFEFSALNYTLPEKNQFKYMLKGFDKDWYYSGTRKFGRYSGLPDGKYTLRITGSNNDGIWNNEGVSIDIYVKPPLWRIWWAYLLYAATIIGLIFAIVYRQRKRLEQERIINVRLRNIDRLKDEFVASTSHELKTPLNGIIGLTESLIDGAAGPLDNTIKNNLMMISQSGRRLANLVNDILDYSRLRQQDIHLQQQVIDIKILADVVIAISRPLLLKKNIFFKNIIPENTLFALADENRIQQILYNLIGNAIKFTNEGRITIDGSVNDNTIVISVTDTGIGICKEEQQRIFDSFEQIDSSVSRKYGGTGLGLAISKKLVELHGGKMHVVSEKGKGAAFFFTLTKASDPFVSKNKMTPDKDIILSPISRGFEAPVFNLNNDTTSPLIKNILIVDDEPVNLQVLENYLTMENYNVIKMTNGRAALKAIDKAAASNNPFDLVVLDVMIPEISGLEACREIRKKYTGDILPVIMLTAKNRVSDLVAGLNAGANDYLAKPFHKEELLARIRALMPLRDLFIEREKSKNEIESLNISLENRVKERTAQLESTNSELEATIKLLKSTHKHLVQTEKMAALGALVAGIAHEISTPVGVCVTASSFLEMKTQKMMSQLSSGGVNEDIMKKYFASAVEASSIMMGNLGRAAELIQGFKQIAVDQTSGEFREFNMLDYINEILTSLGPRYKRAQPDIDLICPGDIVIKSYPGAFAQILTNLIVNSLMHGFEDKAAGAGKMTIEVVRIKDMLMLYYSDNGTGMEQDVIKKIFDPFFTTKRGVGGGSGLGMHIVFNIVTRKLNGTIGCKSSPGQGVTFTLSIPV